MATQMQVDWYKASEQERHNRATEAQASNELFESSRHNKATEYLQGQTVSIEGGKLSESIRHNYQTERLGQLEATTKLYSAQELERHNRANENIETRKSDIQQEYNRANIGLGYSNLAEQSRHNVETEKIGQSQAAASLIQAAASTDQARASLSQAETAQKRQSAEERQRDKELNLKTAETIIKGVDVAGDLGLRALDLVSGKAKPAKSAAEKLQDMKDGWERSGGSFPKTKGRK